MADPPPKTLSPLQQVEAIRAGTGRGVLPCYVGDGDPLLERLTPPIPEIAAEYWIIVHRDLRRAACVRAVIDWVKALCRAAGRARQAPSEIVAIDSASSAGP